MKFLIALLTLLVSLSAYSAESNTENSQSNSNQPMLPPAPHNTLLDQKEKVSAIEQEKSLDIHYYKPMYIAYGDLTKIQVSFRIQIFEDIPLNFAYSQIIFWELDHEIKPFLDATYNPEFFYRWKFSSDDHEHLRSVDLGIFEHNSNGKSGTEEARSYDQSYVRANYAFQTSTWVTQFSGKLRYIYDLDETNRDISTYISPLEFEVKFLKLLDSWLDRSDLRFDFYPGGKYINRWDMGGYQVSLDFHIGGVKVVPAFYLQYYTGYAETLLNYNERVNEFRVGLSL